MKKATKNLIINISIIILTIILAFSIINKSSHTTDKKIAECIGENSVLYTQEGCPHCKTQKEMFGENSVYLNEVDCTATPEKCMKISATPSWIINGTEYKGLQSIENLKELTNC